LNTGSAATAIGAGVAKAYFREPFAATTIIRKDTTGGTATVEAVEAIFSMIRGWIVGLRLGSVIYAIEIGSCSLEW
jgi:hypothetical protein